MMEYFLYAVGAFLLVIIGYDIVSCMMRKKVSCKICDSTLLEAEKEVYGDKCNICHSIMSNEKSKFSKLDK